MRFLKKLKKKHYIQCGLAVLLTSIALYLTPFLWVNREIIVSFDAEAFKNIEYQLFYTEDKGQKFNRDQSIKKYVKKGASKVNIVLPIEKIVMLRLDVGNNPGKVVISDLVVSGEKNISLNYKKFKTKNIDKFQTNNTEMVVISKQGDPYLIYSDELNLLAGANIDWYQLIIISILAFLLSYKFVQYLSKFKMEKNYSRIDIVMLAVFFGLLWVPMCHISNTDKSEQENRMLTKKPQLTINGIDNYGVQFDAWYNDHFFGRESLVHLHDYLQFGLNKNNTGRVMLGKDGWIWGTGFNEINIFQNTNLFTPEELQQVGEHIENFVKNAKKSGVKEVYFILSNDKESMYPEFYPTYIKKENNQSRLEQVVEYIHKNYPQIKLFNFKKELDELKAKEIIFYKAGTHLNHIGAFAEYSLLMQEIKKDFPELQVLSLKDFDVKMSDRKFGDFKLYNHFSVLPFYSEDNLRSKVLVPKYTNTSERKNLSRAGFFSVHTYENKEVANSHNLLIISDSFLGQYIKYLAMSFNRINHLFFGGGLDFEKEKIENFLLKDNSNIVTDIVIVGSTERFLHRFLTLEFPKDK